MKQRQREQVQRGCAVGTVVLLAWLCRVQKKSCRMATLSVKA